MIFIYEEVSENSSNDLVAAPQILHRVPDGMCGLRQRPPSSMLSDVLDKGNSFAETNKSLERGTLEQTHDEVKTTTFVDDGTKVLGDYTSRVDTDDISVRLESINDFLGKPLLINRTLWSTADLKNTELWNFDVGSTLTGTPYWMNKLQGFSLIRATACVRIQINANPFQQGRLLAHFLPTLSNRTTELSYAAMHNACIATKRQQPCIEIDCKDAVGVFEIPYISPVNWFNLVSGVTAYDWGRFYIDVLSPLKTGAAGETTVEIATYLYFKDIELAAPLVPQMAGGGPKNKLKTKVVSRKEISAKESESMDEKPLSSALRKSALAVGILGEIPLISEIAKPTSWALDVAAGVASFLGWSKPINNTQPMPVTAQFNRYLATSEGVNTAYPLAVRSDNSVGVTDGLSITNEDEMSLAFLTRVGTCVKSVSWSTGDLSGTSLLSQGLGPSQLYESGTTVHGGHTVTWRAGPPVFYLAENFNLWRGSFDVTVKVIKTDFHIGRLQVTWSPGTFVGTSPDLTTSMFALREIVDIREGSEFTLNLPYMIESHYISKNQLSGVLDITVLNELRAPETVSSTVDLLIYYSGGKDFEFQAPGYDQITAANKSLPFSPQMGDLDIIEEGVGNEVVKRPNTIPSEAVNGEVVASVKQLLARNSIVRMRGTQPATSVASVNVWPWFAGVAYLTAGGALNAPNCGGDIYSKIAPMYAFYKGSMDVTMKPNDTDTGGRGRNDPIFMSIVPRDPTSATYTAVSAGALVAGPTQDWISNTLSTAGFQGYALTNAGIGFVSARVPYYGRTKCSLNVVQTYTDNVPDDRSQPFSNVNFYASQSFNFYTLCRNTSDDHQFTYFIGAPPVYYSFV